MNLSTKAGEWAHFPVTKVERVIEDKGVSVARRGEGTRIASAVIQRGTEGLHSATVSTLTVDSDLLEEKAENAAAVLGHSLKWLSGYADGLSDVLSEVPSTIRVHFLTGHEVILDTAIQDDGPVLRLDIDPMVELESQRDALIPLYGLGLAHACYYLSGLDEKGSIDGTLTFYAHLSSADQSAIQRALSAPMVDNDKVFLRFLQEAVGGSQEEKDRLIAWVRARTQIELPYNSRAVRRAIAEETEDLAALRMRIYNAINDSYVPDVDTAHSIRLADYCLENDIRLVGGRFSRAFYIDAMLMASAKVLPGGALKDRVALLEDLIREGHLDFQTEALSKEGFSFETIGGETQRVVNLAAKDTVSLAEVEGAMDALKKALREFETSVVSAVDVVQRTERERIAEERAAGGVSATWDRLRQDRNTVRSSVDELMFALSEVEVAATSAPQADPAFMVFFQRLFPLDAINMGMVNELEDPFFGEDENVHRLIRTCGHHMYVTPNLQAWLKKCDDWIEALPAYATYQIVPDEEGRGYSVTAWVMRSILEDMYRRHAEDWALNIEEVMDLEHVALARDLLAEALASLSALPQGSRGAEEQGRREEVIRQMAKEQGWAAPIAYVAALIEGTYRNLCLEVARCREKEDLSRMEALREILRREVSKKNLLASLRVPSDFSMSSLSDRVRGTGLGERVQALRGLALKKRRNLPCVHVLTTLGPGESEINVQNWLEETMALFNVSRAYGLEEEVERRIQGYQQRIIAVGRAMVQELDLEGDLYTLMEQEGLKTESETDRDQGILRLIASYPEVSEEVTTLCLIHDYDEGHGVRERDPCTTEEPERVIEILKAHPEVVAEAMAKVVAHNALQDAVTDYAAAQGVDEAEAARAVVMANPDYAAEKVSLERSEARRRVMEELGLSDQLRTYMRAHLDPIMAKFGARRELVAERKLSAELNHPLFRYDATGPFKKYNLLYTPSRVDLGAEEVHSVRNVPKWVGGLDQDAANAGKALYSLYNVAGPTAVDSPRLAEFLKVGENFFSRGGVYYLSLAAGANIDALGIGDFEFFRDQWNLRGDRIVLPTGETYGGFCVPKEFSLLYAIIIAAVRPETRYETLNSFGVPPELHDQVVEDLRKALRMELDCADPLEWEMKAGGFLAERYADFGFRISDFGMKDPHSAPRTPHSAIYLARLPQLAKTLEKQGVLFAQDEEQRALGYELAYWINKKAQGLEEINRAGPFRKVHLIRRLVEEARRKNPHTARDHKLIGVMGAPYKEGERRGDREIPITDVRFSAGARKLEIYAGTAEHHLLKDIDPEGRDVIRRMFKDFQSPADIRMVGTCTGSDILNHVPGSGLEDIKEDVYRALAGAGLDDSIIDANCAVYGGDLSQWSGIKELSEGQRTALIGEIGPRIHLLVTDRRGPYRRYEEAIQGVDFVDLSIPDPELLDLVDDLPKLLYLMRKGRPDSALVLADGTSGARRRAFAYRYASCKRKVKEWFALDERTVYGCLGLGQATLSAWRAETAAERDGARALFDALVEGRTADAEHRYDRMVARVIREGKAEEAAQEEVAARKVGAMGPSSLQKDYRYLSDVLGRVKRGLRLDQLDFGTWLILGGTYVLNGRLSDAEIQATRTQFERAMERLRSATPPLSPRKREEDDSLSVHGEGWGWGPPSAMVDGFAEADVDYMVRAFLRPRYTPPPEGAYQEVETGIAGSLKAAEEQVSRLEKREARRRQARRAGALRVRRRAFLAVESAVNEVVTDGDFDRAYETARSLLGDGRSPIVQEAFGPFLAWAKGACTILLDRVIPDLSKDEKAGVYALLDPLFSGGEVSDDLYRSVEVSVARRAERAKGDREVLERTAMALELLDRALLVEKTQDIEDPEEMMIQLARFFDITVNNHVFDYVPYHYYKERGAGFEGYTRQEKFELSEQRHRWLYTYARHLMVTGTRLADLGTAYQDAWIGDADWGILPLGVHLEDPVQQFWFSYARLRDASVLVHEGFSLPEIFQDLDPSVLHADERPNVVIVYPHGNTTVPVAMEQGARLAEWEGMNLMLTAFPSIVEDGRYGRKVLHVHDGFMYICRADYQRALVVSGLSETEAKAKAEHVGEEGVLVAASFSRPVIAHGVFFHFTHPLRPFIHEVQAPLIQPFIWEAATHLKCQLPDMLRGSGTRTADQLNWTQKQTGTLSEEEAKVAIERDLRLFAETHDTIIVKPEKESGGRKAMILPVQQDGRFLEENIAELRDLVYDICKTDNAVIQDVLKSRVRPLYSRAFLEDLVDRFARIGIPVLLDRDPRTPLFSYFRQILVLGERDYEISHHITVVSTRGIANVGQGGLLYEYTDDIIHPKYREDLRQEITRAAYGSMESQRRYIREHWQEILEEYLAVHPEYAGQVQMEIGEDLTGFSDADIPYEMGDYMPVFLVDQEDHLTQLYDEDTETFLSLYDVDGRPTDVQVHDADGNVFSRTDAEGHPIPISLFDEDGHRLPRFDSKGRPISSLVVLKIEPNPGAGLWRPHNDQLPPERKGEGVYIIFKCLGQRAGLYREQLELRRTGRDGESGPLLLSPAMEAKDRSAIYLSSMVEESLGLEGMDAIAQAVVRAREELGRSSE